MYTFFIKYVELKNKEDSILVFHFHSNSLLNLIKEQ